MAQKGWELRKRKLELERSHLTLSSDLTDCPTLFHVYRRRLFRVFRRHAALGHTPRLTAYMEKGLHLKLNHPSFKLFDQTRRDIVNRYKEQPHLKDYETRFIWRRLVRAFYLLQRAIDPKNKEVLGLDIKPHGLGFSQFAMGPWSKHPEFRTWIFRPGSLNYKTAERKWFFHGNLLVLGAVQVGRRETLVRLGGLGFASETYTFPCEFEALSNHLTESPVLDVSIRRKKSRIDSYSW